MLQIIGWMGCLYLVVKALEILSSNEHQTEGKFHGTAQAAAVLAIVGAIVFVFLLQAQVEQVPSFPDTLGGI